MRYALGSAESASRSGPAGDCACVILASLAPLALDAVRAPAGGALEYAPETSGLDAEKEAQHVSRA